MKGEDIVNLIEGWEDHTIEQKENILSHFLKGLGNKLDDGYEKKEDARIDYMIAKNLVTQFNQEELNDKASSHRCEYKYHRFCKYQIWFQIWLRILYKSRMNEIPEEQLIWMRSIKINDLEERDLIRSEENACKQSAASKQWLHRFGFKCPEREAVNFWRVNEAAEVADMAKEVERMRELYKMVEERLTTLSAESASRREVHKPGGALHQYDSFKSKMRSYTRCLERFGSNGDMLGALSLSMKPMRLRDQAKTVARGRIKFECEWDFDLDCYANTGNVEFTF